VSVLSLGILRLTIDLIYCGVAIVLNLMIGLLTLLVGLVVHVIRSITKVSIKEPTCNCWPTTLALLRSRH
jgi:TRAP-type C4-dicarboxylate transport system permease large subunit